MRKSRNDFRICEWEFHKKLPETLFLDSLTDDVNGLKLDLSDDNSNKMTILFSSYVAYRNSNESERLRTLNNHPILCEKKLIYIAYESDFLKWIISESLDIQNGNGLSHYIIVTPEDIVDIISIEKPKLIIR